MADTVKPIYNILCAYHNCTNKSTKRLFFALGFSALFCHKCAKILLTDRLATPEASDYEKENYFDGLDDID
jgi:hypothetical protein